MENNNYEEVKLCPVCGAKNKAVYKYCNECGEALNQSVAPPVQPEQTQAPYSNATYPGNTTPQYSQNMYQQAAFSEQAPPVAQNFDGISIGDIYEYTGRKAALYEIIRKLHFESGYKKYCWPLLILGLLFGFFGMGCWYLYHKLYKPAVGFFAAAIASCAVTVPYVYYIVKATLGIYENLLDGAATGSFNLLNGYNSMLFGSLGTVGVICYIISMFISVLTFVLAIIMPFSAYKLYKNTAVQRIKAAYARSATPNISKIGGTAGGKLAVAIVLGAVSVIVYVVAVFSWLLPPMFQMITDYANEYGGGYYSDYNDNYEFYEDFEDYYGDDNEILDYYD